MTYHADTDLPLGRRGRLAPARFTRLARPGATVAALAVAALALAACGSSSPNAASASTTAGNSGGAASSGTTAAANTTVKTTKSSSFGTILVNSAGMALYTFSPDGMGTTSKCTGTCLAAWPALTVPVGTTPTLPAGVSGTLATAKQANGALQVTYNGQLLYTFLSDSSPGQVTGNGVAMFNVVKVSTSAAGASAGSTTTKAPSGSNGY
jgi:predicted lipoprotein with Yx(FWY)xxD motif